MPDEPDLSTFRKKLEEKRRREQEQKGIEAEKAKAAAPGPEFDDLVPEDESYELTDTDKELDKAVDSIDILTAYAKWCGKMTPKVRPGQVENIMVSCPNPAHLDKNPDAWINLDKQTYMCGPCGVGGDKHDIAAYYFGFPVPAYKSDKRFHELRIKMAEDFGYRYETYPGDVKVLIPPSSAEPEPEPEKPAAPAAAAAPKEQPKAASKAATVQATVSSDREDEEAETSADIIDLFDDSDDLEDITFPQLNWREILPKDTFLWEYMEATSKDDVVEEYHFWHGLLAVGFAIGRDVRLWDSIPVMGNLFICTLGRSGAGKSKARTHLVNLASEALPHDWSDPSSKGVEVISAVSSAEYLVKSFEKWVSTDPADPKSPKFLAPVKGLIDFNELSALIGRANRMGNVLKPTLMQFYDGDPHISTGSLSTGKKEAALPFGSALTTTQPLALRTLIGRADDDSGFLNRWVFVGGPEKERFAIGGVRVNLKPAIPHLKAIQGWASTFGDDEFINWSDDAAEMFTDFFHSVIEPDKKKSQNALLTRMDLLMKKLILLFAANKKQKEVTAATVHDAISCYSYIVGCYGVPASQIGNTLQNEINEAVLYQARKQAEEHNRGISLNELARSLKRRKYPNDMLLKVIDTLVKLGYLEPESSPAGKRGRPTVRYRYVA